MSCLISPWPFLWSSRLQEALPRVEDEFEQGFVALSLMELLNQEKLHGEPVGRLEGAVPVHSGYRLLHKVIYCTHTHIYI